MKRRARGEGSIYQQKDGRWVAAISLGNGKRKVIYRRTKAEAVMALQLANQAKLQGTLTSTRNETVEEFLSSWLQYWVQPKVRERTYKTYREIVAKHLLPAFGQVKLQRLTAQQVQKLYQEKLSAGCAPSTVLQIHKLLRRALNHAIQVNHLAKNVCLLVQPPRVSQLSQQNPLTVEQAREFLKAALGDPLEALYVLALTTGMRQGELLGLTWADLDLTQGIVQVQRSLTRIPQQGVVLTELKTRGSRRRIELTDLAIESLTRHHLQQEAMRREVGDKWLEQDLVFCNERGKPLHANNLLRRSFHPLSEKIGLPHLRFHDLRHSTATLLLLQNVHPKIVQEILGHSKISVTLDTYSHVLPTLQTSVIKQFSALFSSECVSPSANCCPFCHQQMN